MSLSFLNYELPLNRLHICLHKTHFMIFARVGQKIVFIIHKTSDKDYKVTKLVVSNSK